MRNRFLILPFLIVLTMFFASSLYADYAGVDDSNLQETEEYTMEEVEQHNTPGDCWMVFEDGVYDFSEYLPDHDKFMDIREWCGMDMTEDFKDKAGIGRDHREGTYDLLGKYYIGQLETDEGLPATDTDTEAETVVVDVEKESTKPREYNIWIPFLLTTVLYWGMYFLIKKGSFLGIDIHKFNAFWNTVLLLTLLIPGMAFGIFMIIRTQRSALWNIDFDFMYWHVQLSLVMGFVAIYHFIQRIPQYMAQIKRKKSV
jgi:cytochrome b involved in lipid metabolism